MFTGIIETLGTVRAIDRDRSNVHFTIESPFSSELKIDQSVSHNGVCLTVTEVRDLRFEGPNSSPLTPHPSHVVTAVEETLRRTNLGSWAVGTLVNLERCLPMGGRLDGRRWGDHL